MSLVEKCWMITSNVSVIAVLIITGICFGIFVRPYMKKKKEEMLIAKNVFKVSDFKTQKKSFNERFEKYINFCENKL